MLDYVRRWPDRVWAIEGCEGIGRHVAQRLLALGETVVDVPAKLSARMRVFATGQGRKTDDTDAHSIALVGVRMTGLQHGRRTTTSWRCCDCWSTDVAGSVRTTPGWSVSSTSCCWS